LTAPVRWSLVNNRILGFSGNRYARHTLTDLEVKLGAGAQ
jgi:peptide/nickel transport system substrate-binding protein